MARVAFDLFRVVSAMLLSFEVTCARVWGAKKIVIYIACGELRERRFPAALSNLKVKIKKFFRYFSRHLFAIGILEKRRKEKKEQEEELEFWISSRVRPPIQLVDEIRLETCEMKSALTSLFRSLLFTVRMRVTSMSLVLYAWRYARTFNSNLIICSSINDTRISLHAHCIRRHTRMRVTVSNYNYT